jgi:hypothetical protein
MLKSLIHLAAALGIAALAAPPAAAEWLEAKSPHFIVYGNMPEAELRRRTERLERFDSMLRHILAVKQSPIVTVYVVEGMSEVQDLIGNRDVGGFYNASAQRAFAVVPKTVPERYRRAEFTPELVIQHEYTHHMLLANAGVFMPGWAQEGLAEMFSTADLKDDGSVVIGAKVENRGSAMFGLSRWSVRRLLESDLNPPQGEEAIEKYSRGWAAVHYLWMSGERPGQYTRFLEAINKGVDPVTAGQQVFGDLDKFTGELNHYVNVHTFKLSSFSAAQLGATGPVAVRRLGPDEVAIIGYHLASAAGVNERTAGPLAAKARPVGALYPNSVPVQEAMAEILYDAKDYEGADTAADRVLAADPNNLMGLAYKGRVAVRRALAKNDTAGVVAARRWFRQAAQSHQDSALPFMLYYDSFTAVGQTPPADAIAGLYRAVLLVPQDDTLHVRAALSLVRAGDVVRARSMIAPAAFVAHGSGENAALKLLKEMDKTRDPQALLAKASELKLDKINEFVDPPKDDKKDS